MPPRTRRIVSGAVRGGAAVLIGLLLARPATAQLLDEIELRTDEGIAEARIKLHVPVRYLRHFPLERGEIIAVFLQTTTVDDAGTVGRREYRKSPPSDSVPCFTVTITREGGNLLRDPFLMVIRFREPVSFKLRTGEDQRSFSLYLPVEGEPKDGAPKKKYYDCP